MLKVASPNSTSMAIKHWAYSYNAKHGLCSQASRENLLACSKNESNLKVSLSFFRRRMNSGISNAKEAFQMLMASDIVHALIHKIITICSIFCRRNKFTLHVRRRSDYTQVEKFRMLTNFFSCEWFEFRMKRISSAHENYFDVGPLVPFFNTRVLFHYCILLHQLS